MISFLKYSYPVFIILLFISCFSDTDSLPLSYELNVEAHPENSLMANLDINISESGTVVVSWFTENTSALTKESTISGRNHEFTLIAMRPETTYDIKVTIYYENGSVVTANEKFITGALPDNAPTINLLTSNSSSFDGITLFGFGNKEPGETGDEDIEKVIYWGVDNDGEIVWYLHGTNTMYNLPFIRELDTGGMLISLMDEIRIITSTGETIKSYDLSSIAYHHDAIILPNGNLMLLATEYKTLFGVNMVGDNVLEVNTEGEVVWDWSSFDHLDTSRFPSELSLTTIDGFFDWTHLNALYYIEAEDAFLISSRSQNWVVKVSRSSGDVLWILGDNQEVSDDFEAKFFNLADGSWFNGQHACTMTSGQEIMLYDNRNETGGETVNSRAVIYSLDETNLAATQEWEYVLPKYTNAYGDVDELTNGNILVTAGGFGSDALARILEVNIDTLAKIMELLIDQEIYRAEKVSWENFLLMSDPN